VDTNSTQKTPSVADLSNQEDMSVFAGDAQPNENSNIVKLHSPAPLLPMWTVRGFQLTARTPLAVPMVDAIDEVLRTLTPHGSDL